MALEALPIAIGTPPPDGSGDASRNQFSKFTDPPDRDRRVYCLNEPYSYIAPY